MKKFLLLAAAVMCFAICGTALAVTYYDAATATGSVTADNCVILDLNGSTQATSLELAVGQPASYKIACGVTKSTNATVDGKLTITLTDTDTTNTLSNVTVALYSDNKFQTAVEGKSCTGAGKITVEHIAAGTDYFVKITIPDNISSENLAKVSGNMKIEFEQVVATA